MPHRHYVETIRNLPWSQFDPLDIAFTSFTSAREFAVSLRGAKELWPQSNLLRRLCEGELRTRNLQYGSYNKRGDHWKYLAHFLARKQGGVPEHVLTASIRYLNSINQMSKLQRAWTVFSREIELPDIFSTILAAHDWEAIGLGWFGHYIRTHIELDSENGGHADISSAFHCDPVFLAEFWHIRLCFYQRTFGLPSTWT